MLANVLDMFSLPFQVVPSPLVMRQFVKIGVFLPKRLGFPFVGAAEMAGIEIEVLATSDESQACVADRRADCSSRFCCLCPAAIWGVV